MDTHHKCDERCAIALAADALMSLLESDFGQSGVDVRREAIICELEDMYKRGYRDAVSRKQPKERNGKP